MSRALITESYLTSIANAIRAKLGVQDTYTPPQMAAAIQAIPTGITPTGTLNISENGTHDVAQYATANVNVSGGGSVNWKTQSEWDAMTYEEKRQSGLTLIGSEGSIAGRYFDYSSSGKMYFIEGNNIVTLFDGNDFVFHAFYSHTSGDRASAQGRGATWGTSDYRVICNALPTNGGYGFFCAFALSSEALVATNTQYYGVVQVDGFNLYCGGNLPGGWSSNTDVTFTHNNVTQTLQSMYSPNEYTLRFDQYPSATTIAFNSGYNMVLQSIYQFLSDMGQASN